MTMVMKPPRTVFRKRVRAVGTTPNAEGLLVLRSSKNNRKVGKGKGVILKGPFRGLPLYALTLEERATCPKTCGNWNTCYGDGSFMAVRWKHGEPLTNALWEDLQVLTERHGMFVVRLHILGDFYSVAYVRRWDYFFRTFGGLHVFGYTHWPMGTSIGDAVTALVQAHRPRCAILRSDGPADDVLPVAATVGKHAPAAPGTVVCPEQTEQTESCLTCGLCMNGRTSVSFRVHHYSVRE